MTAWSETWFLIYKASFFFCSIEANNMCVLQNNFCDAKIYYFRFPSNEQRNSVDGPSIVMHDDHDSDETSYTTNGTRRVIREIIV